MTSPDEATATGLKSKIRTYFDWVPPWNELRALGNVRIMKFTMLAPFLPFIFSFVDNVISIPILEPYLRQFRIDWPTPRLHSLYYFYYGLTLLGIGSIVYAARCPRTIKEYADSISLVKREAEITDQYTNLSLDLHQELSQQKPVRQVDLVRRTKAVVSLTDVYNISN